MQHWGLLCCCCVSIGDERLSAPQIIHKFLACLFDDEVEGVLRCKSVVKLVNYGPLSSEPATSDFGRILHV
jgi:hypothetical protein